MKCGNCGYEENKEGSKFCKRCGCSLAPATKWCVQCGTELKQDEKFCTSCGAPQMEGVVVTQKQRPKKKKPIVLIICVVVVLVIIAGVIVWFYMENNEKQNKKIRTEEQEKEKGDEEQILQEIEEDEEAVVYGYPIPVITKQEASSTETTEGVDINYLQDKKADTAWVEGVDGSGIDEYVTFTLKQTQKVYGIAILPGNLSSSSDYEKYSYPTKLTVCAEDMEEEIEIKNYKPDFDNISSSLVFCDFEEPIEAEEVTVYIKDTEVSGSNVMTAISEMYLYYYPTEEDKSKYAESDWKIEEPTVKEYILEDSNTKYLSAQDLEGMTAEECRIARNEIYARHGRIFDDEGLKEYFSQFDWYEPTIKADDFKESMLNKYEIANRDLIVEYEEEQGYR